MILKGKANAMQWLLRFSKRQENKLGTKDTVRYHSFFTAVYTSRYIFFQGLTSYADCFGFHIHFFYFLCEQLCLHPLRSQNPLKGEWKAGSFAKGQLSTPKGRIQDTAGCTAVPRRPRRYSVLPPQPRPAKHQEH